MPQPQASQPMPVAQPKPVAQVLQPLPRRRLPRRRPAGISRR
jgi:hypothetical protein